MAILSAKARNVIVAALTDNGVGKEVVDMLNHAETTLGFYSATHVAQAAAYTQTYATATRTHANDTSADFPAGGTGAAAGAWDTSANRDLAITRFNALRVDVDNLKQLVNSVIDDLQALGLVR